jgi:hypothetical protein
VITAGADMEVKNKTHSSIPKAAKDAKFKKGMVLPFQPLSLVFENVNYYIDMPNVNSYSPSYSFDICIFMLCQIFLHEKKYVTKSSKSCFNTKVKIIFKIYDYITSPKCEFSNVLSGNEARN